MPFESAIDARESRPERGAIRLAVPLALTFALCIFGFWCGQSFHIGHSGPPSLKLASPGSQVKALPLSPGALVSRPAVAVPAPAREKNAYRMHVGSKALASALNPLIKTQESTAPEMTSLPTGTRLMEDRATAGLGKLDATNGTDQDAYIVLMDASTHARVRQVFIKAHDTYTLEHLAPRRYQVFFTTGLGWDGAREEFRMDAAYVDFGQEMRFEETPSPEGTLYDYRTITLNGVPHGETHALLISKAQFHALTSGPVLPERPVSTSRVMSSSLGHGESSGAQLSGDVLRSRPAGT